MKPTWIAGFAAVLFSSLPAAAQPVLGAKSGIVNYVEGEVFLAEKALDLTPAQFPEIKENNVLRSEEGRAEILLTPGIVLRIGESTSFKMLTNRLVDTRLEFLTGSATVVAMDVAKETNVTFTYGDNTVTLAKEGIYRFDMKPGRLRVFKGAADVKTANGPVAVTAGKSLSLEGTLAVAEKFNADLTDSLDHWTRRRDELMAMSNASAANQARKVRGTNPCGSYGTNPMIFNLGSWGYNPYYGLGTYIPCRGQINSPYGYRYWSPAALYRAYFAPRPVYHPPSQSGGGMGSPSYTTVSPSSGGYSGVSSSSSGSSAPVSNSSAPSSGSSSAVSAGSSSVGGGASAGGGGGRGH
jgi:hypothetical protein